MIIVLLYRVVYIYIYIANKNKYMLKVISCRIRQFKILDALTGTKGIVESKAEIKRNNIVDNSIRNSSTVQ